MKSCIGCKYLACFGNVCRADSRLDLVKNPLTGAEVWRDRRFPDQILMPSPEEMRKEGGRCGPDRIFYKRKLMARLFPLAYEGLM